MTTRMLTLTLAATAMAIGGAAQASPGSATIRSGSPVGEADQLTGNSGLIAVLVGMAAILSILIFDSDGDDRPASP